MSTPGRAPTTNPCPACTPQRLCDACRAGTPVRARGRRPTRHAPTPPPPTEPVDFTPGPIIVLLGSAAAFFGLWHLVKHDHALSVVYVALTTTIAVITGVLYCVRVWREHGLLELWTVLFGYGFRSFADTFLDSRLAALLLTSAIAASAGFLLLG